MELVIRPRPGRHRRPLTAVAVVTGLLVLCTGAQLVDDASLGVPSPAVAVTVALALSVVPALVMIVLVRLNVGNVVLRATEERLVSVEWTGRTVTLDRPSEACLTPVGSAYGTVGELLIISGRPGDAPAVLVPRWWHERDLERLLQHLDLTAVPEEPVAITELAHEYPGARLPWSLRHPLLFTTVILLPVLAYLAALIVILGQL